MQELGAGEAGALVVRGTSSREASARGIDMRSSGGSIGGRGKEWEGGEGRGGL